MDYNKKLISIEVIQLVTSKQAWFYLIVPFDFKSNVMRVYSTKQRFTHGSEELNLLFDCEVIIEPIEEEQLIELLTKYYRKKTDIQELVGLEGNDFLIEIIREARRIGSSDIHFEPYKERCRIRMRVDGKLIERYVIQYNNYPSLINKIKIRANLDIAEKRLPQDGRILYSVDQSNLDIRVSVLPTMWGEKVVLRLLYRDTTQIDINNLGLTAEQLIIYKKSISKSNGLVLISGPTGSGKTTTLYATLKRLNESTCNIITIEDPIEYTLEGINQVQCREDIGLSFANALRSFLRQDPDIIMLGEIRDIETAQMAIRASLTGHLVLSTIHTNSAFGTISRLLEMGVPSYLLVDTLNISVAQRLVRKLCPKCKKKIKIEQKDYSMIRRNIKLPQSHYIPVGCNDCYHTGYKGRRAIFEMIEMNFEIEQQIHKNYYHHTSKGFTLADAALEMLNSGETSLEEILPLIIE